MTVAADDRRSVGFIVDIDFPAVIELEGRSFADACARAAPSAQVAGCPGWDVRDLLWHMTDVDDLWRAVVEEQLASPRDRVRPDRPADDLLDATYREGLARVVEVLRSADPSTPAWNWTDDRTVSWVVRRLGHEMTIHRWDAELAAGDEPVLDPGFAADGIDEFLFEMLARVSPAAATAGGSVHLHCTDVDGEWTVRPGDDGSALVTREHAKGDAAIRGAAGDLLLVLWRRLPLSAVEVLGDRAVAERFVTG